MSGEDTQDRTDRLLLTPWVKFLWESYRQCLDLLRNNSKVERLYHDIAQQGETFSGGPCPLSRVLVLFHYDLTVLFVFSLQVLLAVHQEGRVQEAM